jgi:uncharacterized cofD-like protein
MSSQSWIESSSAPVLPLTYSAIPRQPHAGLLNVVCFGGGTGLSTLLKTWKNYVATEDLSFGQGARFGSLTAVVAVSDNGGSSGRLRNDFQVLPPGDIRNCVVALADDGGLLSRMFQFRFAGGEGLDGHSFGNLFLTVLASLTSDFVEAVKLACELLETRGQVLPATNQLVELAAELNDGSFVTGETTVAASLPGVRRLHLMPPDVSALPETLAAIAEADLITVGPGSLYTSLIPNLLVKGIPEAIRASRAVKALVCNLMTQHTETLGMTAADHVRAIYQHAGPGLFDCVLVNRAPFAPEVLAKYAAEGAEPVICDRAELESLGLQVIEGDYLAARDVARHAAQAVAQDLVGITSKSAAALAIR